MKPTGSTIGFVGGGIGNVLLTLIFCFIASDVFICVDTYDDSVVEIGVKFEDDDNSDVDESDIDVEDGFVVVILSSASFAFVLLISLSRLSIRGIEVESETGIFI